MSISTYLQVQMLKVTYWISKRYIMGNQFNLSKTELRKRMAQMLEQVRALSMYHFAVAAKSSSKSALETAYSYGQEYDNAMVMVDLMCKRHGIKRSSVKLAKV